MDTRGYIIIILFLAIYTIAIFGIGFYYGAEATIKKVVDVAKPFVSIDKNLVKEAIYRYQNYIKRDYP